MVNLHLFNQVDANNEVVENAPTVTIERLVNVQVTYGSEVKYNDTELRFDKDDCLVFAGNRYADFIVCASE